MRRWLDDRIGSESGANAVEFALLAPVVFLILFGTIYGGWAWNTQQTLTHAARDGARFAATLPGAPDSEWVEDVKQRTVEAAHGVNVTDDDVSVALQNAGPDDVRAVVRVEHDFVAMVPLLPANWSGMTLSAEGIARYEPEDG